MRRIIGLALLIGVFAGGYHLGRQKDSPDLIGYARQAVTAIAAVAGDVADSFSNKNEDRGVARDGYRADADASRDDRAYVDTRAYVNDGYAPQPSRYAPPEPPQPDRAQASGTEVAQAGRKSDSDWAARLWKSLQDQPAGR